MKQLLSVEVFFDFVCPWCLIGQRHLQAALLHLQREQPQVQVQLQWRGVQLLPGLPASGVPFHAFYLQRLGSEEAVRERQAQVRAAARVVGEDIDFSRIRRMPNTGNAHRLLQRAAQLLEAGQLEALLAQLFIAYFHQGRDLGIAAPCSTSRSAAGWKPRRLSTACVTTAARSSMGQGAPAVQCLVFVSIKGRSLQVRSLPRCCMRP